MLYLDAPIGPINGMMIYRDHQDTNLFYYVPERPRLARNDGIPEFVYLKYKRDITDNPDFDPATKESLGGGFMAFTVDLGVEDNELEAIKDNLREFASGEIKLTPIQFRKGSVRLSISKDAADAKDAPPDQPRGLTFFEETYGTTKPSLFGFNRANFAIVLSQEAATLFEAALRSGISPIGVIYDLEFLGLSPAFDVKITAEYSRIYDHLETEFGVRGQVQNVALAADIATAFQKLVDDGSVKVEVLNFTDDQDLRKQANDAVEWFKTELLKDFFKSALEPPGFMKQGSAGGLGLLGQLQNLFGALNVPQTTSSLAPVRGIPTTEPPNSAPAPEDQNSGVAHSADSNRAVASAVGSGAGAGTDKKLSPFQAAFSLKSYRQEELKTRVFEYSMQTAVVRQAAPQGLFSTITKGLNLGRSILEVNLDDEFFKRLIATVSIGGDLDVAGIKTVAVNLEYPGVRKPGEDPLQVDGFVFTSSDLSPKVFTTWLNDRKDLNYRYQMELHFKPDSPWAGKDAHVTADWSVTRDRQLTLDPLDAVGLFDVLVSFGHMDSGQVAQVQAELSYEDVPNDYRNRKTIFLKPGDPPAHWQLRLSNPQLRTYTYRVLYFLQENARYQSDWISSEDSTLVINEPFKGTLNVRLVPLLDPNALVEAVTDVTYEEQDTGYKRRFQRVFSPTELKSQPISIPTLSESPSSYLYKVTVFRSDGSVFESDSMTAESSAVVISDGPGTTHRIKVKLIAQNLTQAGLAALKVDMVGPGDTPDSESALFTPSQMDDKTVSLVQPDGGGTFVYSYRVTGYTQQGIPVPGDSGQSSEKILIVGSPVR